MQGLRTWWSIVCYSYLATYAALCGRFIGIGCSLYLLRLRLACSASSGGVFDVHSLLAHF